MNLMAIPILLLLLFGAGIALAVRTPNLWKRSKVLGVLAAVAALLLTVGNAWGVITVYSMYKTREVHETALTALAMEQDIFGDAAPAMRDPHADEQDAGKLRWRYMRFETDADRAILVKDLKPCDMRSFYGTEIPEVEDPEGRPLAPHWFYDYAQVPRKLYCRMSPEESTFVMLSTEGKSVYVFQKTRFK